MLQRTAATMTGAEALVMLRASAINQDGRSSGLTAPNGPSQAALIRSLLPAHLSDTLARLVFLATRVCQAIRFASSLVPETSVFLAASKVATMAAFLTVLEC